MSIALFATAPAAEVVNPPLSVDQREFLLSSMRVASLNLKSRSAEIDCIGTALQRELITTETACDWLDQMGVLRWLPNAAIEG